jgi:hypothetical protein
MGNNYNIIGSNLTGSPLSVAGNTGFTKIKSHSLKKELGKRYKKTLQALVKNKTKQAF